MQRGRRGCGRYPRFNYQERGNNGNIRRPVVDLRDKLNRMREEKERSFNEYEEVANPPPPDPTYNFLKDPLRGDTYAPKSNEKKQGYKNQRNNPGSKVDIKESDKDQKNSTDVADKTPQNPRSVRFNEEIKMVPPLPPRRGGARPNWTTPYRTQRTNDVVDKKVQNPKQQSVQNIKVELSGESGERKCTFDESKTVEVPIVSKMKNYTVRPKSGWWSYRGPQRYYNKQRSTSFRTNNNTNDQKTKGGNKRNNNKNNANKKNENSSTENSKEVNENNNLVSSAKDKNSKVELNTEIVEPPIPEASESNN